jgi:hypothetical protein
MPFADYKKPEREGEWGDWKKKDPKTRGKKEQNQGVGTGKGTNNQRKKEEKPGTKRGENRGRLDEDPELKETEQKYRVKRHKFTERRRERGEATQRRISLAIVFVPEEKEEPEDEQAKNRGRVEDKERTVKNKKHRAKTQHKTQTQI